MSKARERRAAALEKILAYMLEHEGAPRSYYTPAELAYAANEPMSYVGTIIGETFGVSLRRGYGYPADQIYRRWEEILDQDDG